MLVSQHGLAVSQNGRVHAQSPGRDKRVEKVCGKVIDSIQGLVAYFGTVPESGPDHKGIEDIVRNGEAFCKALRRLDDSKE